MTVSTADYYEWWRRGDSLVAPYNACSPNLVQLMAYYKKRWGAVSLGCHNERPVRGGTKPSTHSWGAALDPSFPSRAATIDAMNWSIAYSAECGINAIHDYATSRIWYPSRGWHTASIQAGSWIHVETLPDRFLDSRPIEDRLSGSIQEPPGGLIVTPEDKAYLDSKFDNVASRTWAHALISESHPAGDVNAGRWLTGANDNTATLQQQLDELNAKLDAQEAVAAQILAAIQGASFPISGTAHIGTT